MIYLPKQHEYRINTESEFEEGTGATDDRQARKDDNDMLISFLHCVEWKQLEDLMDFL